MSDRLHASRVLILDFGSQYTQLIARRVREAKVYCEIYPCTAPWEAVRAFKPRGVILSGGPASVYAKDAPLVSRRLFRLGVPVLGICYGMQLLAHLLGGRVARAAMREYGRADLTIDRSRDLFYGIGGPTSHPRTPQSALRTPHSRHTVVWMSHGDRIEKLPPGFRVLAHSANSPIAAMGDPGRCLYGVQFHPEVAHTPQGTAILRNFLFRICGCSPTWTMRSFIEQAVESIRHRVGQKRIVCALSGGVDSSVAALLVHRAVGDRLTCIFVDNGLLRKGEAEEVEQEFRDHFHLNLRVVRAEERFLKRLRGVEDPEEKRRRIGHIFVEVFEEEARRIKDAAYLAQGTLYPDVIESISFKGPSATIKTHHNVGGLPAAMWLKLVEPLRELFKDEVRQVGRELGLPDTLLARQPFPGPGLAIRILGEVTRERLAILREADAIVEQEIRRAGLYRKLWQSFAVLLPVRTVGVMGDERTYEHVIAVRAVTSLDGMTADWASLPPDLLGRLSNRIINEVKGVNRVVYDVSSKPPSTIEWE